MPFICAWEHKIGPDQKRCQEQCAACREWYPTREITPDPDEEHPCLQGKPCNCEGACLD